MNDALLAVVIILMGVQLGTILAMRDQSSLLNKLDRELVRLRVDVSIVKTKQKSAQISKEIFGDLDKPKLQSKKARA